MKTLLLAAAVIAAIAGPTAAQTRSEAPAPKLSVRYADLKLDDPQDARVMLGRIRRAAVDVCSVTPGAASNDSATILRFEACYRKAVTDAVTTLNAAQVTAAFKAKAERQELARLP